MNYKIGDRVRFLNDVGGGRIARIIDKKTLGVLGDDGFEIPVLISEVVLIDTASDGFIRKNDNEIAKTSNHSSPLSKKSSKPNNDSELIDSQTINVSFGITNTVVNELPEINFISKHETKDPDGELVGLFVAFVPKKQEDIINSDHDVYIINDSPFRAFYTISKWEEEGVDPIKAGFLYPDTKEHITTFKRQELNSEIILNIQALFFKNSRFIPQQPEFFDFKVNSSKFFRAGSFTDNDFFEERALVVSIADTKKEVVLKTLTDKVIAESIKEKDTTQVVEVKPKEPDVEEIDLHIEELVENPTSFTSGQMLEIQIARFRIALEGGLKGKTRKMVFIHGVGNGKLKHEIRRELEKNYPKLRYQDASFREYGYGATMVFLR